MTIISSQLKYVKSWYSHYERYLMPSALFFGFFVDLITFQLINFGTALILLFFYLFLASLSIIFINFFDAGIWNVKILNFPRIFAPLLIQYSFGAILSASMIFYSFSGSLFTSWPFILALFILFLANEILKKQYKNFVFQLSMLFFAAFSLFILTLPFVTHILGFPMFVSSGILSLVFIFCFINLLQRKISEIKKQKRKIIISVVSIFTLINIFYFTNTIPPFPLSVREKGVYHSLERMPSGDYKLVAEKKSFWDFFLIYEKFSITPYDDKAVVFSSIFSPARLNTEIIHEWQYLDPNGKWQTLSNISFPLVGGRKEGYRGYSEKDGLIPGKWRINVKTRSGQTISRIYFKIIETEKIPALEYQTI